MKKVSFKWGLLVIAIVAVFGGLVFRRPTNNALAQTACPTGLTMNISQGAILTGMTPIYVGIPTTTASFTINKVVFKLDTQIIGQARNTSGTNAWSMQWATQLATPGTHQLNATVSYNQTATCILHQSASL